MAHNSEILTFRNFVDSLAREKSLKIVVSESEDGEGQVFKTKGKRDIVVNLQTNVRNDTFLREVTKFFDIDHADRKSWPATFTKWEVARRQPSSVPLQKNRTEYAKPSGLSPTLAVSINSKPTQPATTKGVKTTDEMRGAAQETAKPSLHHLQRVATNILTAYGTLSSAETSAFLHHFIDKRCGQPSPRSNLQAHEIAYAKLSSAFNKVDLSAQERQQLKNAVTIYMNASSIDRTRNREQLILRMATAMKSLENIEPDFEAIAQRRKQNNRQKTQWALS